MHAVLADTMHWLVKIVLNSLPESPVTIRELCQCTCIDTQTMSWAAVELVNGGAATQDRVGRLSRS